MPKKMNDSWNICFKVSHYTHRSVSFPYERSIFFQRVPWTSRILAIFFDQGNSRVRRWLPTVWSLRGTGWKPAFGEGHFFRFGRREFFFGGAHANLRQMGLEMVKFRDIFAILIIAICLKLAPKNRDPNRNPNHRANGKPAVGGCELPPSPGGEWYSQLPPFLWKFRIENGPHFFCQNVKHLHAHLPFFNPMHRLQKAEVGIDHGYL